MRIYKIIDNVLNLTNPWLSILYSLNESQSDAPHLMKSEEQWILHERKGTRRTHLSHVGCFCLYREKTDEKHFSCAYNYIYIYMKNLAPTTLNF